VVDGGTLMRLLQGKYARLTWQSADNAVGGGGGGGGNGGDGMEFIIG